MIGAFLGLTAMLASEPALIRCSVTDDPVRSVVVRIGPNSSLRINTEASFEVLTTSTACSHLNPSASKSFLAIDARSAEQLAMSIAPSTALTVLHAESGTINAKITRANLTIQPDPGRSKHLALPGQLNVKLEASRSDQIRIRAVSAGVDVSGVAASLLVDLPGPGRSDVQIDGRFAEATINASGEGTQVTISRESAFHLLFVSAPKLENNGFADRSEFSAD